MGTIFGNTISEESVSFYRIGTVSIIPRTPTNTSATTTSSSAITVSWTTLGTETGNSWSFNLLYYSTDNVNFSQYGNAIFASSIGVTGLTAATTYYFKVRTVWQIGGINYFSYDYSPVASAQTYGAYVAFGGVASNYTYNGYKYSFIVTSGSFTVQSQPNCMVIVVGGGGGGGAGQSTYAGGGGGGGGVLKTTLNIIAGSASAVIGQGGAGQIYPSISAGNTGGTTSLTLPSIGVINAYGGGGGGSYYQSGAYGGGYANANCLNMGGVGGGGGGLAYGGGGVYYSVNNALCSQAVASGNYGGARGWYNSNASGYFGGGGGGSAYVNYSPTPGAFYTPSTYLANGGYPYMCSDTGLIFSSGGGGGQALNYSSYGNGFSGSVNYGSSAGISGYASMNGNGGTGYGQQYYTYPAGAGGNATLISSPHNVSVGVNALNHNYGSGGGGGAWYGGRGGTGSQGVIIFRHL